ncbi:MAG: nickel ABC transporter permease [Eubacteriales bacterium]|nr:ABC transporter permease [Clostridiales bacterium]MDY5836821.1 nickel ABC transporter permease [Eubacteriales bacterium]
MLRYIFKRIVMLIPVLLGVTFIVFTLLQITPGDPAKAILGPTADAAAVAQLREEMGLNEPFLTQYGRFVYKLVFEQDMGRSYSSRQPVMSLIMQAFPATLKLAAFAVAIAVVIGIPLGIISAIKQYSIFDNTALILGLIGISMPVFWLGMLMILVFAARLKWFPSSGFSTFRHMVLPSIALSAQSVAVIMRMTRSSMLEVIRQDYIRTARAKGQTERKVITKHALRNALMPIVTTVGLQFGALLGGAVLTESVFTIPGIGRMMVEAIRMKDFPLVQGAVLFIALAFSLVNLFVDILYAYINPRIRSQYK